MQPFRMHLRCHSKSAISLGSVPPRGEVRRGRPAPAAEINTNRMIAEVALSEPLSALRELATFP
jgi:hypothetical protein